MCVCVCLRRQLYMGVEFFLFPFGFSKPCKKTHFKQNTLMRQGFREISETTSHIENVPLSINSVSTKKKKINK